MSNRHFAVIGDPITHSLSPFFHQTAFDIIEDSCACNADESISAKYVAYQVKKEDLAQFMNMFCGRKSTRVFRPLCLLKEGDTYANELWEYDSVYLSTLDVSFASQYNIPHNLSFRISHATSAPILETPLDGLEFSCASADVQDAPMSGLSVTLPHKKEIMQYVDRVTPLAMLAGAANTLYWDNGQLVAHNTDVDGFLSPLYAKYSIIGDTIEMYLESSGEAFVETSEVTSIESPTGGVAKIYFEKNSVASPLLKEDNTPKEGSSGEHTAMILGAGGAAAAVLVGLLQIVSIKKIYVCARNIRQAENLCEHVKKIARENKLSERLIKAILFVPEVLSFCERNKKVNLVINTIPATLNGQSFNPRTCFNGVDIAYDLLYAHTPFLQAAKEQGVCIINGGEMFLQQGARQFKLWTGKDMPQVAFDRVEKRILARSVTP